MLALDEYDEVMGRGKRWASLRSTQPTELHANSVNRYVEHMIDERFYAMVTDELRTSGTVEGLWSKAYAESDGDEPKAKALYLRYRAAQLAIIEAEAQQKALTAKEANRQEAQRLAEEARRAQAQAEGMTPIHWILLFLLILVICLTASRWLG